MPLKGFKHSEESKSKMAISHTGLHWSSEHKKNHLKSIHIAVSKPEYIEKMRLVKTGKALPMDSLVGASEKNKNAKEWWFIHNRVDYRFKSLNKFVRDNKHLFSLEELTEYKTENRLAPIYRATVMLRNLHLIKADGTPVVQSFEWHGWTIGEKHNAKPTEKSSK